MKEYDEEEMEETMGETTPMKWYRQMFEQGVGMLANEATTFVPPKVPKYPKVAYIMQT